MEYGSANLVPRLSPSFPSLAVTVYRTASDGKLGKGLGTRLWKRYSLVNGTLITLQQYYFGVVA